VERLLRRKHAERRALGLAWKVIVNKIIFADYFIKLF
jgi:hypothetical protein